MRKWRLLLAAILLEATATLSLRVALDHAAWFAVVAIGYTASFAALTFALRQGMALGAAYGIWAASGVALTALASRILFKEPLTKVMSLGIGLIVAGVLAIELGAAH
ncbi:SMR family transporter [Streptomyces decoyicus]|uniref:SMR family transporter n=1 Tax=Streptomyces decoyicus TaxID=249567 RepID=A0ABZ1F8W5_9ACTN|nr:SMR family transporter [Streptomyces decoyicus]WSB66757.1 SMR family transporter [Streptomyces decoyicus]